LEGELDKDTLRKALQYVVSRHEILRTIFHMVPGMEVPIQVVVACAEVPCLTISLENLSGPDQAGLLNEYFTAAQEEPFDLEHGPLLRAMLLRLTAEKHVLLLSLPTLCADAATLTHLIAELCQVYADRLQEEDATDELLQYDVVSACPGEVLQEEVEK